MKLGIYSRENTTSSTPTYIQQGLYDFETEEWHPDSSGAIVSRATRTPSPEELKVRFDLERRDLLVCVPERLAAENATITVPEYDLTVSEGHAKREEQGGPLDTQVEKQHQKDEGVIVVPDDFEFERGEEPENAVRESDWEPLDFTEEFDFEFHTEPPASKSTDSNRDNGSVEPTK